MLIYQNKDINNENKDMLVYNDYSLSNRLKTNLNNIKNISTGQKKTNEEAWDVGTKL
jgi:hypothetical protein